MRPTIKQEEFITEWGGMRLENGYLITEDGLESLNDLDTSICFK